MDNFIDFAISAAICAAIGVLSTSVTRLINPACGYEIMITYTGGYLASKMWAYISSSGWD
jgi:hypothetical protein